MKETTAEWRSRDTKFLTLAGSRWCHLNGRYRRRVTFGVVVRALVPNRRMSDFSPAGHGLTTRSPMVSGGFGIAAHARSFALRVPAGKDTC